MDTDFSLEDKEEDIFSSDIKLITYPQELTDKKEVNLKPHTNRRNTKVTDYIYTMQNGILEKILLKDYSLEDLFSFLMYDLILNHDKSFFRLKNSIKEEIECDTKLQTRIEISFLKEMIQSFRDKETDLFNKLKEFLQKEEAYSNDLLIYSTELCMLIFEFLDVAAQTKCYKVEIEDKKKYNYTNNRKVLFNEVYSLVKPNTVNVKLMGGAVYRECKKLKIGKSNGFTTKYLCVDKEESNLCESTVKRKKQNENLNLKKNKQQSHEKIKAIKMPLNFFEDTQNRIVDFKEIKYKTYKISDETFKTNNESKKMTGKNLCGNIFDEKEERVGLCNEEFLHGLLQFNESEDDPDLRYKIVFQDDFDDQHGFISKMEGGEKECSSKETESLSS